MDDIVLRVNHLTYGYGANCAIDDVSFSASRGDYAAIVGHNGSGKTTLIKLLLGLLTPHGGELTIQGVGLPAFGQWQTIGYLPQSFGVTSPLFPATVAEIVSLGLISSHPFPRRLGRADWHKVDSALERMHIEDLRHARIGELSGGQMQRTLLARALVNDPSILFLNEPVSAVDAQTREEFFALTASLCQEKKTTILLITHDLAHSGGFANKLLYLDKHVVFYGAFDAFTRSKDMKGLLGEELSHVAHHQHKHS